MKLTKLLIYFLLFLIPLGQFGKIPFGSENVNLYIFEILILVIFFVWLGFGFGVRKSFRPSILLGFILFFVAIAFISLLNGYRWLNLKEWVISGLYLLRFVIYSCLFVVIYDIIQESKRPHALVRNITNLLILSGVLLSLFGFIQLIIFPDFSQLDPSLGWDPHYNRLLSTFFDPNFLAAYLVLTLTLIVTLFLYSEYPMPKFLLTLNFLIVFIALVLTFSRSGYLMFAVTTAVIGVLKSRKLIILALLLSLTAYLLVPRVQTRIAGGVDPDDSARFRFESWKKTLVIIKEYPLTGVGFNAYRYAQSRYGFFSFEEPLGGHAGAGSDSSLLFVFATTGIFGLLSYLLLLLKISWESFKNLNAWSLAMLAGLLGLLVESNFINSLFYPWILLWFWIVTGVVFARKFNDQVIGGRKEEK